MPNTYTQIFVHVVFAVRCRARLISPAWKVHLHKYITGIIRNKGHKLIAINSMPDHVHIFIGLRPHTALSDLIRDVKRDSTVFVNEQMRPRARFAWQQGFGAFSYARSQVRTVYRYILNQEAHHRRCSFHDEYVTLLKAYGIQYEEQYLFDPTSEDVERLRRS